MNEELKKLLPPTSYLLPEFLWLASYALDLSSSQIMAREKFSDDEIEKINSLIKRRENHEPLQYIMGVADFYGRDFEVGPGVLIPRHDTETLIEAAKKYFSPEKKFIFLDWGTGSGCIAVTLLLEFKNSFAVMLEKSPDAIYYAKKNLERFNLKDRAEIISEIPKKNFDLIISNPPYIPSHEIKNLMPEVKNFEPELALDGGIDGMNFYRLIFSQAKHVLKSDGYIILETGNLEQVSALKNLDGNFIFEDEFLDTGNFPRCLVFRRKENETQKS